MDPNTHAVHALPGPDARELLRQAGLKATEVRVALLDALRDSHGPFTLEELHRNVGTGSCDLVTMYRSLAAFQKVRLVQRCDFGDGIARYEWLGVGQEHHHHVICLECREVRSLDHCLLDAVEESLRAQGYQELTHSLEFFGRCAACTERSAAAATAH